MNRTARPAVGNLVTVIFVAVGMILLVLALHLDVNPVDGSVVDASVRGTWIPIFLFFATFPAMAVMFLTGGGPISLVLMFLTQAGVYWAVGRGVEWLFSSLFRPTS